MFLLKIDLLFICDVSLVSWFDIETVWDRFNAVGAWDDILTDVNVYSSKLSPESSPKLSSCILNVQVWLVYFLLLIASECKIF